MDEGATETQPGPSRRPAKGASRNVVRVGAIVALAVAAGIVAWVLIDRSDDEDAAPATTAEAAPTLPTTTTPATTTPSETVSRPVFRTIPELRAAAAASAGPIYWVGARAGTRLEVSETSGGTVFVRYLPLGTAAGAVEPYLTVATYSRPNGFAEVQAAAKNTANMSVELDGGGLAVYDESAPTNVHVAYPGEPYQVEVFSPDDGVALRLVSNGKVAAVPAP